MDNASFIKDEENGIRQSCTDQPAQVTKEEVNPFEENGKIWPQILAAFGANMGAFSFGTVLIWSATAVPSLRKDEEFPQEINDLETSWITSIITLGALAASLPVGYVVDHFGRKRTLLLATVPLVLGWLLLYFSQNIAMLLVGRFITGLSSGAYTLAAPIFIAETSQPHIRGMLISCFDTMACLGVLFELIIGTYIGWRFQALFCLIAPVILFSVLIFVPESPRYLMSKGQEVEASKSLCWLRGVSRDSQLLVTEIKELNDSIEKSRQNDQGNRLKELWKPAIRRSMLIGFMLFAFQIFSGMTAINFYRVEIFESSKAGLDEYTSSIIMAIVDVVASMVSASVVDRFGRKFLMISSELIMSASLAGLGGFFYVMESDREFALNKLAWLPLLSLVVFVAGYSFGIGNIPYTVVPEILPQRVRGLGSSILTSLRWILAFLVSRFFKDILNGVGAAGCYFGFAGCCLFGAFYVFFWVPETKGKTLEGISKDLNQ